MIWGYGADYRVNADGRHFPGCREPHGGQIIAAEYRNGCSMTDVVVMDIRDSVEAEKLCKQLNKAGNTFPAAALGYADGTYHLLRMPAGKNINTLMTMVIQRAAVSPNNTRRVTTAREVKSFVTFSYSKVISDEHGMYVIPFGYRRLEKQDGLIKKGDLYASEFGNWQVTSSAGSPVSTDSKYELVYIRRL